jgi:hypothetical protein
MAAETTATEQMKTPELMESKPVSQDPFAAQRTAEDDPFTKDGLDDIAGGEDMAAPGSPESPKDMNRRMSREWGT